MENFNAESAREIVRSIRNDELHNVCVDIKSKAEQGETVLHIYKSLHHSTITELKKKGFNIIDQPSIAIQRDSLYCSIFWD